MKIGFEDDVQLIFDGGHWDDEKKSKVKEFLRGLTLDVLSEGGDVKLEARSWKESEGVVNVDTCPTDLDYATIYSKGLTYSGIAKLDGNRYQVEVKKDRMRIKDSVLEMSIGFFFK